MSTFVSNNKKYAKLVLNNKLIEKGFKIQGIICEKK